MADALQMAIREMAHEDIDLTYSSWVNSLRHMRPWSGLDPNYHSAAAHALMTKILQRKHTRGFAAIDPRFEDQIYGLCITDGERGLYWLYVRHPFRRQHVATRLLDGAMGLGEPIRCAVRTAAYTYHKERWALTSDSAMLCGP